MVQDSNEHRVRRPLTGKKAHVFVLGCVVVSTALSMVPFVANDQPGAAMLVFLFGAFLYLLGWKLWKDRFRDATIGVANGSLTVVEGSKTSVYSPAQFERGYWVAGRGKRRPYVVLVEPKQRTMEIEVPSAFHAESLLAALGVDRQPKVFSMRASTWLNSFLGGLLLAVATTTVAVLGAFIVSLVALQSAPEAAGIAAITCWLSFYVSPLVGLIGTQWLGVWKVSVGIDSISLSRPWKRVQLRTADIAKVEVRGRALWLTDVRGRMHGFSMESSHAQAVEKAVNVSVQRRKGEGDLEALATPLGRMGRSTAEWRRGLMEAEHARGYRVAPLVPDRLRELVLSPSVNVEHRLGAAMALIHSGGEGAKQEVRFAANLVAEEKVRVALQHLADDDLSDEVLEKALSAQK